MQYPAFMNREVGEAMSDKEGESGANSQVAKSDTDYLDALPEGKYIPYSGGSLGWFENKGVLKSEQRNNYGFHRAMDSEYVRATLFQRWGQVTNLRKAKRMAKENSVYLLMSDRPEQETPYHLKWPGGRLSATTRDISHYGMRLKFTEEVMLSGGELVTVQLLHANGEVMLEVESRVIWVKREEIVRPIWFVGVAFTQITTETENTLQELLRT